ncbi:MAG: VWA domain-containing protein [Treponema sp.]|nr:VWA domain-containing protein [Treponema sp.]
MVGISSMWGADPRTIPIDVYIIVDSSSAMEKGKEEAMAWLCNTVIDGMLLQEDRIWIWAAGSGPDLIYSGSLGNKEEAKAAVRSIRFQGNAADYRGALQQARVLAGTSNRTTYTLLVSGSGAKDPPTREAESAGLLRYSRVESFSGWRVLTVGLDLDPKVTRASSFYKNRR